jgi:hypothetical protein
MHGAARRRSRGDDFSTYRSRKTRYPTCVCVCVVCTYLYVGMCAEKRLRVVLHYLKMFICSAREHHETGYQIRQWAHNAQLCGG